MWRLLRRSFATAAVNCSATGMGDEPLHHLTRGRRRWRKEIELAFFAEKIKRLKAHA